MTAPSTLTAAREAERAAHEAAAAATKHRVQVEKEERDKRPTVQWKRKRYRLSLDGKSVETSDDNNEVWGYMVEADYLAALASLLPRKPVVVTDKMVADATAAYLTSLNTLNTSVRFADMRAALEAVASDLSAPVAVAAPTLGTPVGYVVKGNARHVSDVALQRLHDTAADARTLATEWNEEYPVDAPHDVYALHRVPDETEGAANG